MPRPKKKLSERTDEEIVKRLFPRKKVVDGLKKIAHEKDKKDDV